MGQKGNLLTLRKKNSINFLNLQYNNFLPSIFFLQNLFLLFAKKRVLLLKYSFNILANQATLILHLFFQTTKIRGFKKKFSFRVESNKSKNFNLFSKLYHNILFSLKTNLIFLSINNLNLSYNKIIFLKLFSKFKFFHTTMFPRRFNFFIDFLKITLLFLRSIIDLTYYSYFIGQIFKILPKKRHNFFLSFMEQYFKFLIIQINNVEVSKLQGIKFMLSGRIQAKPRAKFKYFQVGKTALQSVDSNVEFAKTHVFTLFGVFGLKIWTYKI